MQIKAIMRSTILSYILLFSKQLTSIFHPRVKSCFERCSFILQTNNNQNLILSKHSGHGELLELRLLEKSARHNFIIARHHSSNNIFSCHLLESS
jgi:hypothetical protein